MQSQFTGMVHHPMNSVLPLVLVPLITIIIKSLKKSKAVTSAAAAAAADPPDDGSIRPNEKQGVLPTWQGPN